MAAGKTRGPYAKTALIRERIIGAGAEVFAESGYRASTMKEVAARAGISERGLVHHFKSKAELLAALLERREGNASERVLSLIGLPVLDVLLSIVEEDSHLPGMVELHTMLSAEATSADHPAHDHYVERYHHLRLLIARVFDILREQGELNSPLSSLQLASAYVALSDGLQLQWLYEPEAVQPSQDLRAFFAGVIPRLAED